MGSNSMSNFEICCNVKFFFNFLGQIFQCRFFFHPSPPPIISLFVIRADLLAVQLVVCQHQHLQFCEFVEDTGLHVRDLVGGQVQGQQFGFPSRQNFVLKINQKIKQKTLKSATLIRYLMLLCSMWATDGINFGGNCTFVVAKPWAAHNRSARSPVYSQRQICWSSFSKNDKWTPKGISK